MINTKKIFKKITYQFNINNLETAKYILEECNELKEDVILGVSEGAVKYMGGYNVVYSLVKGLIKDLNIKIKVVLHLDHGSSFTSCKQAIDAGFTSVMIDASNKPLNENIKITKQVVKYAKKRKVTVEGELGGIGGTEDGTTSGIIYTDIKDALKYVEETKIDSLAPAIGSVHGFYKGNPNLNFKLLKELNEKIKIPLVLHGGTGIPEPDLKKCEKNGIRKINVNTELQDAWTKGVRDFLKNNEKVYDPRKIISSGEKNMKQVLKEKINIFRK